MSVELNGYTGSRQLHLYRGTHASNMARSENDTSLAPSVHTERDHR
jgi:hypothetical protein